MNERTYLERDFVSGVRGFAIVSVGDGIRHIHLNIFRCFVVGNLLLLLLCGVTHGAADGNVQRVFFGAFPFASPSFRFPSFFDSLNNNMKFTTTWRIAVLGCLFWLLGIRIQHPRPLPCSKTEDLGLFINIRYINRVSIEHIRMLAKTQLTFQEESRTSQLWQRLLQPKTKGYKNVYMCGAYLNIPPKKVVSESCNSSSGMAESRLWSSSVKSKADSISVRS